MSGWIKNIINKIKDLNGSIENYKEESVIQSLPTVACVNKAKKLISEKKFDLAEEVLLKALDISTQDSNVYKYLGKIEEIKYEFENASEYYNKSAHLNPQDKEIWVRLGMSLLNSGKPEDSLKAFERANKITPINTDVFTGWGMAFMKLKKYTHARDKFNEACKISKYNFTAILLSAVMEIRLGEYNNAEPKLQFLAKVAPNEGSLYEYANLKLLKSEYDEAEKLAQKVLEINKKMLPAYFILGEIYSIQKEKEKTNQIFSAALENDLDAETLHYEWGKAYLRFFDFKNAGSEFSKALEKNSDYNDAKAALALIQAKENDFSLLDEIKEKLQQNVFIQEGLGLEYLANNSTEEAIDMFKKALSTDETQTYNYINIARAYDKLENKTKTKEFYEKFIEETPWFCAGILEYSNWLIKISNIAEAQRKLRKAEKLEPQNTEILNLLFFTSYTLVKENICEYNVKEAITLAEKVRGFGDFKYENEKSELENILKNLQGNN